MSNPEELNPELEAALRAELTQTTPAPAADYWDKIDASLSSGAATEAIPTMADTTSPTVVNEVSDTPAVVTNSRQSRLTKAMMGSAAGLLLLVVGGFAIVSLLFGSADGDSVASDAFATEESAEVESAEEFSDSATDLDVEASRQSQEPGALSADESTDSVEEFAEAEGADAEEPVLEGSGSASDGELTPLDSLPWLLELETGRVLAEDQLLSFAESDIDSAGGQLGPVEIYLYRFIAVDNGSVDVILSGEVADITYDIYDTSNSLLAEDEIITNLDVAEGEEYFVVITSEAATTFEFELSISRT